MAWEQDEIRNLKENRYIVIDEEPCRIKKIDVSKPGKHGEAKARIEAIGIFDGKKHSMVNPVTHKVRVPIIDKKKGQVISLSGTEAKIMDLNDYNTFNIAIDDDEILDNIEQGQEVNYMTAMGRKKITRV
ncbi:MAG: translation initiation factor IF-5A [Candidatus Saliniplasma sp.]